MLAQDHDITVFSLFPVNRDYNPQGFAIQSLDVKPFPLQWFKLFTTFYKVHRKHKFHVVHGFWALPPGFFALILAKIFKVRSIVSVLGGDAIALPEIRYGQLRKPLQRAAVLWTLRHADEVIVLTNYLFGNLKRYGLQRDVTVMPWGIDTALFSFKDKPLSNPVKFLHVANLSPVKDPTTMLKAFKSISNRVNAFLTIIGTGVLKEQVQTAIRSLSLEQYVRLLEPVSYENVAAFYHDSDILLHTSLSEGQSEVVTEAMSAGVIACGTQVGLMYDLPECCISVPVRDHEALAKSVLELLEDETRMREIRARARAWAELHSIQWTANEISRLYVDVRLNSED
jgi:glycosyltransferase involved in cell wall biosynthesis